ncbi:MAG: TonB C-terminal domain-containing protein [Campylobacterales bacterium]|nr:TonB C-terminal domain-containing protein [Campylobacterales bacterium]
MGKNGYFALGGIGALALYAFFIVLVAISLMDFHKKRSESIKSEQSAIEVNIEDKAPEIAQPTPSPQPTPTEQPTTQQQTAQVVKTTKPEPKKQADSLEPTKIMKTVIQQETKQQPTQTKQTKTAVQPQQQKQSQPQVQTSAANVLSSLSIQQNRVRNGEQNEYLMKIKKIILQKWNWQQSDHGKMATIELNINKDGSFTFKLLDNNNRDFSNRAVECLKSLQQTGFPPPPNSKAIMGEPLNFEGYKNSL